MASKDSVVRHMWQMHEPKEILLKGVRIDHGVLRAANEDFRQSYFELLATIEEKPPTLAPRFNEYIKLAMGLE